jgi:prolyl oligopeptidase
MQEVMLQPPVSESEAVTDIVHGLVVTDPYRWLEDQNSIRTRTWLEAQAAYTRHYFVSDPARDSIRQRVQELLCATSAIAEPWNVGNNYFFLRRSAQRDQSAIVMREGLLGEEMVLVDPSRWGDGRNVSIASISEDNRVLAYWVRRGGTDHAALEFLDIQNRIVLKDSLPQGFCTGFAFSQDTSGFYYAHRALHDVRPGFRAIFRHRFGMERSSDEEIFCAGDEPNLFLGILYSRESNLLAYVASSTGRYRKTSVYLHSMSDSERPECVLQDIDGCFLPFFARGQMLAYTDFGAPNFRIVRIDLSDTDPSHWHDVVPESPRRIQQFAIAGEEIFVSRIGRFSTTIESFEFDGTPREGIPLPYGCSATLLNRNQTSDKVFYSYTTVSEPPVTFCRDLKDRESRLWDRTRIPFDSSVIAVEETSYTSKDGTSIPLFLAVRRDLKSGGPLPTFITGYGGFGYCVTPRFTAFVTLLIEQGLQFAIPALRGGSELGEEWHLAAQRRQRQNSFDDLIAATEWLLSQNRAAPGRIAVGGGSNAGLLVGAVITQRPDLFRAAICLGPLLDMTRYHLFDCAAGWAEEYGSPDDQGDFEALLAYSPYHRIKDGTSYPAVMLVSGDSDTRCNPMHARKMAARLQVANRSEHPILLDYRSSWGHIPAQTLERKTEALTDRLTFLFRELGMSFKRGGPLDVIS